MLQKFIVYSLSLIALALFAAPAFAQAATPSSIPVPTTVSPTSPVYTDLLIHNMFHTFSCLAVGQSVIGQPCLTYQLTKNAQGAIQGIPVLSQVNLQGGTLGAVTGVIGLMYQNPPVRTYESLASLGETLGIVKQAHAQVVGSGAGVLQPIQTLWQVSRNISYVIMIIIFIIIGLMVMFRQRINPQTVITAQAAIPGLVIGLILITFSYFLAGLISDTAFLGTNLVGAYFSAVKGKSNEPQNLAQEISPESVLSIFSPFLGIVTTDNAASALDSIMGKLSGGVQTTLRLFAGFLAAQFVAPLAGGIPPPWGLIAGPAVTILAGGLTGLFPTSFLGWFLSFVATFVLIYAMLKLLLRLINNYLTIIFLTIAAPFQFLLASLPGRQGLVTDWIMNILGNILVFPAVLAVFYFVTFIYPSVVPADYPLKVSNLNQKQNSDLISPVYAQGGVEVVGSTTFPLFGGLDLDFIKILLAFGALVALPAIPDIVIRAVGKASQTGQLIGQEISGSTRAGQGYFGQYTASGSGAIGSAKRGILGESQYHYVEGQGWVPWYGKPGAINVGEASWKGKWFSWPWTRQKPP